MHHSEQYPSGGMEIKAAVLDFQALVDGENNFIVRELAIEDLDYNRRKSWVFQIPPDKHVNDNNTSNKWLVNSYHGIPIDAGTVSYGEFPKILKDEIWSYDFLFAKGVEKCQFLSYACDRTVFELEKYFNVPSLKKLESSGVDCSLVAHRRDDFTCAVKNCSKLKKWLLANVSKSKILAVMQTVTMK